MLRRTDLLQCCLSKQKYNKFLCPRQPIFCLESSFPLNLVNTFHIQLSVTLFFPYFSFHNCSFIQATPCWWYGWLSIIFYKDSSNIIRNSSDGNRLSQPGWPGSKTTPATTYIYNIYYGGNQKNAHIALNNISEIYTYLWCGIPDMRWPRTQIKQNCSQTKILRHQSHRQ